MIRHKISIIVPAYKQEKTIIKDLKGIKNALEGLQCPAEIICVVDGNVDQTLERASVFAKKFKNVKVVGYSKNKGKGYAIRTGMAYARGDVVGFIDAGMDIDPMGLFMLFNHMEWYKADIIVGSKLHPVSQVNYPWQRKILSIVYRSLTRTLFGFKIRDTQVGIKFFRRKVIRDVLPRLVIRGFAFDVEILAVAQSLGYKRIFEAPIKLDFSRASSIKFSNFWRVILVMVLDTLIVFYRLRIRRRYPKKRLRSWFSENLLTPSTKNGWEDIIFVEN